MTVTKNEEFKEVSVKIVQNIINHLDSFKDFTDAKIYSYSQAYIENITAEIKNEMHMAKLRFLGLQSTSSILDYVDETQVTTVPSKINPTPSNDIEKNQNFKNEIRRRKDIVAREIKLLGNISSKDHGLTKTELDQVFTTIENRIDDLEGYLRFNLNTSFSF